VFKSTLLLQFLESEAEFPLDGGREPLFGRQRSFQTIEKLKVSCDYLHRQAKCNASPTQAPENAQILKTLASAYCPTGAESYDMAEALPRFYEACFDNAATPKFGRRWSQLKQIGTWSMWLTGKAHLHRGSDIHKYPACFENLKFPQSPGDYNQLGIPKYIIMGYTDWKGRPVKEVNKGPYEMLLWRNDLDTKYCPVVWLMLWLQVSRIRSGPIYPRFNVRGDDISRVASMVSSVVGGKKCVNYLDSKGVNVKMSESCYKTLTSTLNFRAGYHVTRQHFDRKSASKWAAFCNAGVDWEIKNAGRWKDGSRHHYAYIEAGVQENQKHRILGSKAPIRSMWVWKAVTFDKNISSHLC